MRQVIELTFIFGFRIYLYVYLEKIYPNIILNLDINKNVIYIEK